MDTGRGAQGSMPLTPLSPDATTGASADRPLLSPQPLPQDPNRGTTARSRGSTIRLRRLTSTSVSSDVPPNDENCENYEGSLNLRALSSQPNAPRPAHLQVPQSPAPTHLQPEPSRSAQFHHNSHHVAFIPQNPGNRNSAAACPDSGSKTPVRLMAPPKQDDKAAHKERVSMFGYRRGHVAGESDDDTRQVADHTTRNRRSGTQSDGGDYNADIVDMLDVLDPEVSTMSSITNVQNSLFVPSMGRFVNRRPTFNLTPYPKSPEPSPVSPDDADVSPIDDPSVEKAKKELLAAQRLKSNGTTQLESDIPRPGIERIPSTLTDRHFAVRPSDLSLATWTDEDLADLDDHVRHMLHSRRSKVGRRLKAFGQYVSKPLGFFVTLYATIIILLGTAWVVFLIGWIQVGDEQSRVIGTVNLVLVTLFSLVGIGLIPWRAVDTYHMFYIVRLERLAAKRLRIAVQEGPRPPGVEMETGLERDSEIIASVLTEQQRISLEHHQSNFAKSHTFYKPYESDTHYAFPIRLLIAIVILLDGNSVFQLALALVTWTIRYKWRPMAATVSLLCCAMACNISAAILISIGDKRTRKKEVVERKWRQELTREAIRRKEKKVKMEEEKRRNQLERVKEEEEGSGRTSSQWLRKSLDVVRGRELVLN